jgi:hypothetical protein
MGTSKLIKGSLSAETLNILTLGSGTSITNLGIDASGNVVSGNTSSGSFTGGTVTGATNFTGGLSATTISATTYQNLPIDPDTYVTAFTYNNNVFTLEQNNGQADLTALINEVTGWTVNGNLTVTGDTSLQGVTATTITATTFSGVSIDTIDYIDFNTGATTTSQVGRMRWNDADEVGTLELDLKGGNVRLQVGEESLVRVFNEDTITLSAGTIVYVFGNQGNTLSVKRASATGETESSRTLGVVRESIPVNDRGFVSTGGLVYNTDTSAYTGGTPLWLSVTPGQYTDVKPTAPSNTVLIGFVARVSSTVGSIFVHISNGWELDELHNVNITSVANGDILSYNSGTTVWENTKTLNGDYNINGGLSATTVTAETITNTYLDSFYIRDNSGVVSINTPLRRLLKSDGSTIAFDWENGILTGQTNIESTTISATTYQNLPTDIRVTGGTYSNGSLTFTNNTGGTFNILTSTNYSAGVISGATYTSTGTGQVNLPAIKVALYDNANNIEPIIVYDVASGTTGSGGIPALVDQDTNYIVVEYNSGTPRYYVYDNDGPVNDSSVVLFMIVFRLGNFVHTLEFGNQGAGLANKLNDRIIMTDRFGWESGLMISLSGTTGIVTITEGVAWNGPYRQSLTAVNSSGSTFFKNFHSGGTWTYTTTGDTLNNTYYDDGTNIVTATAGKYLTNYYYRGQEVNSHIYEVYSTDQYDTILLAEAAGNPSLPELITSHAFLVGRIIVGVGETTGITQTAFANVFLPSGYAPSSGNHNDLLGLQGGTAGEYLHLTTTEYNNLVYTYVSNTFTQPQVFNSGITATTIYVSGNTVVTGGISGSSINITTTPTNNDNNTQILSRNPSTGNVEYIDGTKPVGAFNYGLANAIMTGNFLT